MHKMRNETRAMFIINILIMITFQLNSGLLQNSCSYSTKATQCLFPVSGATSHLKLTMPPGLFVVGVVVF